MDLHAASIDGNLVTLRWTAPPIGPVTGYVVEGGINTGEVLASTATGHAAPTFTFVAPSVSFYVRVHTLNGAERSAASNEIRIFVNVPQPPSTPAGFTGVVNGSAVAFSWRNTFEGGAPTDVILNVTGSLSLSVPLGLIETASLPSVPAGNYTFTMRAVNAAGSSIPSVQVALSVPSACSGAPGPPEDFQTYRIGNTIHAVWEPAASGAASTGYLLQVTGSFDLTVPTPQRARPVPRPRRERTSIWP